jgi:hypothetical protein
MFLATSYAQYAYQNYETVWNLPPLENNVLALMPPAAIGMIGFFALIKNRVSSKIMIKELLDLGIDADTFYTLALLVIVKQGSEKLQYHLNGGDSFFVYLGE